MNTQELAIRIYSEIHYAIEGYYLADAGGEDIKEKIEQAIKDYISEYYVD